MRSKGKNFEAPEICTSQTGMERIDAESRVRYRSKPASMSAMRPAMSSAAARMLPIQGKRAGSPPASASSTSQFAVTAMSGGAPLSAVART